MLNLKIVGKQNINNEIEILDEPSNMFEGELINIGETPRTETESWKYTPLFKEGNLGEIRIWQIGFENNNQRLKIIHGVLITTKGENGKLIIAYHPIEMNKSGRNLQEQALLEARKRYLDQYKNGYLPKGEEMVKQQKEPMLANKFKLSTDKTARKTNETYINNYPVSVMRKLDGIRCLSRYLGGALDSIIMRSRNNNAHEAPLTHIKKELMLFFPYLPQSSELDGELYSMDMGFNELSGVIRTKKRKHEKHDLVNYYIFDIIEPQKLHWEKRYKILVDSFQRYIEDGNPCKYLKIVEMYYANNEIELINYHDKFVSEGYEGLIIRKCASTEVTCCKEKINGVMCKNCLKGYNLTVYRSNRSNAILKYKNFIDEEVTIIGFSATVGTEEGAIKYLVKDLRNNEFHIRPRGTIEERKNLFQIGNELIGKQLTIRYQELSEKGVPRFPVAIAIRDYE